MFEIKSVNRYIIFYYKFIQNSLDYLSKPLKVEKTKLAEVFSINFRDSKKGRLFVPVYDYRFPFVFEVKYAYLSKFLERDNASGNHYHKIKEEILIPLEGAYEFYLEDIDTHMKEVITLKDDDLKAIYIKTWISHKVISRNETGVLLVLASSPSSLDDEIEYNIV